MKTPLKLPPLRAIQAFESVARLGTVSAAADELGVTPGAVSQQLRNVETAIGLRLVERKGRRVALTELGKQYQRGIANTFDELKKAQAALYQSHRKAGFVVSCLPSLASKWVGPLVLDWRAKNPEANIRLIGSETEPRLDDGEADFRITYGQGVHTYEHYAEMFTDWVVPACSPSFLAAHPLRTPADIVKLPLIEIEWDADQQPSVSWHDWAALAGAEVPEKSAEITFSLSSAAIEAAMNGRGFVLAQMSMISGDLEAGRLVVPFDLRLRMPGAYFLAWNRAALEKSFGAAFRAFMLSMSKRQNARSAQTP
ncbi:LysR substrate-binding domain-containing protein [Mesorhizobium sp. KR2-14]|uniref:LysR substrate-binding domain-containing protein n=1 Tax=Mesorhizobium sp. KR2-14 TaxID=3156610 RepID=UPI0032B51A69